MLPSKLFVHHQLFIFTDWSCHCIFQTHKVLHTLSAFSPGCIFMHNFPLREGMKLNVGGNRQAASYLEENNVRDGVLIWRMADVMFTSAAHLLSQRDVIL